MNWEALGAIAEFSATILVLITLIYLATQIKQAQATIENNARAARFQADIDLSLFQAGNETFLTAADKLWMNGQPDLFPFEQSLMKNHALSAEEAASIRFWCFAWFKYQEHSLLQAISQEDKDMNNRQIIAIFKIPPLPEFWNDLNKAFFDSRFADHVDALLEKSK